MKKKIIYAIATLAISMSLFGCDTSKKEKESTEATPQSEGASTTPDPKEISSPIPDEDLPQLQKPTKGDTMARIKTGEGDIELVLYPQYAPKAVENFVTHAKDGYYDNTNFHRTMENFMIQGGDPKGDGTGGESIFEGLPFEDEFTPYLRNIRGALSMANPGVSNSNGSQFFIVQNSELPEDAKTAFNEFIKEKENPEYNEIFATKYPVGILEKYIKDGGSYHLDDQHTVFGQVTKGMDVVDKIAKMKSDPDSGVPENPVKVETIEIYEY